MEKEDGKKRLSVSSNGQNQHDDYRFIATTLRGAALRNFGTLHFLLQIKRGTIASQLSKGPILVSSCLAVFLQKYFGCYLAMQGRVE